MDPFESGLNTVLVDIFNYILRYEELSLKTVSSVPVTVNEAHMLEAIGGQNGGITVSEIAAALKITAPTATVAVKKLESKGFVTKAACAEDGRKYMISLTEAGEKINRAHSLFHRMMVRNISHNLSDMEKDVLLAAVQKLSEYFREKVET